MDLQYLLNRELKDYPGVDYVYKRDEDSIERILGLSNDKHFNIVPIMIQRKNEVISVDESVEDFYNQYSDILAAMEESCMQNNMIGTIDLKSDHEINFIKHYIQESWSFDEDKEFERVVKEKMKKYDHVDLRKIIEDSRMQETKVLEGQCASFVLYMPEIKYADHFRDIYGVTQEETDEMPNDMFDGDIMSDLEDANANFFGNVDFSAESLIRVLASTEYLASNFKKGQLENSNMGFILDEARRIAESPGHEFNVVSYYAFDQYEEEPILPDVMSKQDIVNLYKSS